MAEKILSWNLEGGFGDEERQQDLIDLITDSDPDVAIFREAYPANPDLRLVYRAISSLIREDYKVVSGLDSISKGATDPNPFIAVSKNTRLWGTRIFGGQRCPRLETDSAVSEAPIVTYGLHLSGPNSSLNLIQTEELLKKSKFSDRGKHVVVVTEVTAPLLRRKPSELDQVFQVAGFHDTQKSSWSLGNSSQTDLANGRIYVPDTLEILEHTVHRDWPGVELSNHLAISALVRVRQQ